MKPNDPSLGPPFQPPSLPNLVEAIEDRLGPVALIDLTFPRCLFLARSPSDIRVGLVAGRPAAEQAFLQTMRQRGGHAPIALVDADSLGAGHDDLEPAAPGQMPVLVVESVEMARRLALAEHDAPQAFLFPVDQAEAPPRKRTRPLIPKFDLCCLSEGAGGTGFWLATQRRNGDDANEGLAVVANIAARPDERVVIPARHLVHDGGYTAEGDDAYSWLWTGPSHHFRMIVPRQGHEPTRHMELSIIRTESVENLSALVVQIDGRPVRHVFEPWSDNSGKIIVDLPQATDYTVLGLVVPKLDLDKNSGRALGVCLDKLILLTEQDSR